ncbi:restriction endonuclease subunit S [Rubritalea profundi]|nr:restriction endonuclease subunit S [Rubritalea profundi]
MEKTMVPQSRFREFSDEWATSLLDDYATRGSGHTPSKSHPEYYDGDIPWISLTDSKSLDKGFIDSTKTKITDLGIKNSSAVVHPKGTVLLSRDAGVGKSAVMQNSMAVSQHFIVWKPKSGVSTTWFLYYWLQIMKPHFERIAVGSTIKTIGLPFFKKLKIAAPTLPEQEKIAAFLTSVDARIEQLKRKKSLLQDYKKGVMQRLFSQQLRFKDQNGNPYPDWQEKKLGDAVEINPKSALLPDTFLYIDLESVNDGVLSPPREMIISDAPSRAQRLMQKGDVLYQMVRPYQKNNLQFQNDGDYVASTGFAQLRASNNSSDFIYQLLLTDRFTDSVLKRCTGTSYPAINSSDLADILIQVPHPTEQTKIANFLSTLDTKIEQVTQQITQTQTFKKGLLQQMFV